MDDLPRDLRYRLLEILPGAISWSILVIPFAAAFWYPRAVAIFIMIYVILWFLMTLKASAFLIYSFIKSKKYEKLNWSKLLAFFSENPPVAHTQFEKNTFECANLHRKNGTFKKWDDIFHVVIMPTYKEEKEVLEASIEALTQSSFPLKNIIFVLATEERDRARAEVNAEYLTERFARAFGEFHHIMHPANLPNEIPAKGANITYSAKKIVAFLHSRGVDFSNVLVTTLDADNRPHKEYFSNLTYHYLMEHDRGKRSYQPLAFFFNNIWDVPFTNRLIGLANTFWYLAESGQSYHLFNASVYAQSLDALVAMDYWSRQTIVEDLHQYWRAYFHFKGDHEVVPLFVPVYQDALQNKTYFTSLVGQYKQLRRWAWGSSEIAYAVTKFLNNFKQLPMWKTISQLWYLSYLQITWATTPVIILLNKSIPSIINPTFSDSLFAYNFGQILSVIFTITLFGILLSMWISLISLPRPQGKFRYWQYASTILTWALVPFVTLIYGAIPAIDAQTRLMLNKPLGFTVTEKIRKIN
ncbi:MAG: glycosyltransferase family 2 protein [Patescibacteria group bacterium]